MRRSNSNNDSDGSDGASPISHSTIKDFIVLNKLGIPPPALSYLTLV